MIAIYGLTMTDEELLRRWAQSQGLTVPSPSIDDPFAALRFLKTTWEVAGGRIPVREADLLFIKAVAHGA